MKISKNVVFFLLLFLLILTPLVTSMLPFIIQSFHTPPDRVFMGLHRWSEDYYGYLHLINQGINGHLMTVNKITNEPHISSFIHSEYSFLGLIGGFFGLNSPLTYHISRLVLGAIFLLTTYYFLLTAFQLANSKKPIANSLIAFFLAFFVGGFPHVSLKPFTIEPYLSWWVELDATRRSTILPHYLMGDIFMLLVFILFLRINSQVTKNQQLKAKSLTLIGLFSFLLAFVHPVDFLLTTIVLGLYSLLAKSWRNLVFLLPGLIPIFYFKYLFTLPFYRFIAEHGTTTAYNIPLGEFVLALGPTLILATCYLILNREKLKANSQLLMLLWLVVQTLFFFFGYQILNFDRLRSLHAPFFIPLAFFAGLFLNKLSFLLSKVKRPTTNDKFANSQKPARIVTQSVAGGLMANGRLTLIFCLFLFVITLPLSVQSINRQIFEVSDFKSFSSFSYPSQKTYEAFLFLKNNTPENSFVTTAYETRFLLPAVAANKVALGANFENDPAYQKNMEKVILMYQGALKGNQLQAFLKSQNVSYLYWGYQEKSYGGDLTKENFLQKIFENSQATIFEVK